MLAEGLVVSIPELFQLRQVQVFLCLAGTPILVGCGVMTFTGLSSAEMLQKWLLANKCVCVCVCVCVSVCWISPPQGPAELLPRISSFIRRP